MVVDIHGHDIAQIGIDESIAVKSPEASLRPDPTCGYYQIENTRQSECALVLFARHTLTSERVVIKILREYQDTRYSLETPHERQQCQLEALQRNREFTPEVYIGLVRIDYLDLARGSFLQHRLNISVPRILWWIERLEYTKPVVFRAG